MFVPLLALGLPATATAAVMLAAHAHLRHPARADPDRPTEPELVWTLLASLLIGNTLLLVINLPLAPLWARLLQIPRPHLYAGILFFASLGAYASTRTRSTWRCCWSSGRGFRHPPLRDPGPAADPRRDPRPPDGDQDARGARPVRRRVSGLFNEPLAVAIYVLLALIAVAPYVLGLVRKRRSS